MYGASHPDGQCRRDVVILLLFRVTIELCIVGLIFVLENFMLLSQFMGCISLKLFGVSWSRYELPNQSFYPSMLGDASQILPYCPLSKECDLQSTNSFVSEIVKAFHYSHSFFFNFYCKCYCGFLPQPTR